MIWAIWLQNLMFRHTTDEFLTDRGIYPFFRAGNYDRKLYRRRKRQCLYVLMMKELEVTVWKDAGFHPIAMEKHNEETQMTDFVPKPLYTKKQLQEFRQKNIVDGRFVTDEQTIQSVEDLEKLLFLWQEETDDTKQEETVHIDGELKGEYGFVFSKLVIDAKKGEKK